MAVAATVQASSADITDQLKCTICWNLFRSPRALSCMHTFCEECLIEHILKDAKDDIVCPSCGQRTDVVDRSLPKEKWAIALPINCVLVPLISALEAGKKNGFCDMCKSKEVARLNILYCTDCQIMLCENCVTIHERIGVLNDHTLVPLQSATAVESPLVSVGKVDFCHQHPGKTFEYFCEKDSVFCCFACSVERHGNCHEVKDIKTLGRAVRAGGGPNRLRGRMNAILEKIKQQENIPATLEDNTDEQVSQLSDQLDAVKEEINQAIDDVKESLLAAGKAACNDFKRILSDKPKRLAALSAATTGAYNLLDVLIERGTDTQIFIANRKLEGQVNLYEDIIKDVAKPGSKQVQLRLRITKALRELIEMKRLVELVVEGAEHPMSAKRRRNEGKTKHHREAIVEMMQSTASNPYEELDFINKSDDKEDTVYESIDMKEPFGDSLVSVENKQKNGHTEIKIPPKTVTDRMKGRITPIEEDSEAELDHSEAKDTSVYENVLFKKPVLDSSDPVKKHVNKRDNTGVSPTPKPVLDKQTDRVTPTQENFEAEKNQSKAKQKELVEIESTDIRVTDCVVQKHPPVQIKRRNKLKPSFYISIVHLPDGRLVAGDWKNSLCCLLDSSFQVILDTELPYRPTSLAVLGEKVVAVVAHTCSELHVVYVGLTEMTVIKTIPCPHSPVCVARLSATDLAVGWREGFGILTGSGEQKAFLKRDSNNRRIYFSHLSDSIHVDAVTSRVFQTHQETQTLYCFSITGEAVFSYKDENLSCPIGVSTDRDGNVYVVSCNTNSVVQLSCEGKLLQVISLSIVSPYAICFHPDGFTFLVSNSVKAGNQHIQTVSFKRGFLEKTK